MPDLATVFYPEKLAEMGTAIGRAITEHQCPGAVLWLERKGSAYHRAYGDRALVPAIESMTEDTIFDAASLTKVLATTPAIMQLIERGQVKLDAPVQAYLPEFKGGGKEAITIRQLMTHTSGLPPDLNLDPPWSGYDTAIRLACAEQLNAPPGTEFRYSDINFFLLGEVVHRVTGQPLNQYVARELYRPLRMRDTGFLPPRALWPRIAPTEFADG
ncbi:MAG: beta-lactamase family protein, partial [Verrucomicrobia bacterium]|nr:beta-lactamase family protein [Verrucomicrobiota bacterium]